mgnify:CR=1 FL=1
MKIRYFREFLVLAKYLNFSLAARQLHMTQPGLSRHISAIEKELEVSLLERNTHSVQLTEKGEQFLKGIEKLLEDYDFLCEAVQSGDIEKVTKEVAYYGVNRYLSHIISSFAASFPDVKIDYFPSYPDEIIAALFAKQVDVAVLPETNFKGAADLVFHAAFNEPIGLLVNKSHPLAEKDGVRAADLKDVNFIALRGNWGDALFQYWYDYCRHRRQFIPQKQQESKSIEEAALNLKRDSGAMLLPGHLKEAKISEDVKFVKILDEDCYLTISLVQHPKNNNPVTKAFVDFYLKASCTS